MKMMKWYWGSMEKIELDNGRVQLYLGDCLEVMPLLPPQSVDVVLADLPYAITDILWDKFTVPIDALWGFYTRLLKEDSTKLLFAKDTFSSSLVLSNQKEYKYKYIWIKSKPSAFQHAKYRPLDDFEEILVFSRYGCANNARNKMKYTPQNLQAMFKKQMTRQSKTHKPGRSIKDVRFDQTVGNYPRTTLYYKSVNIPVHPTQKPVELLEHLIKTHTYENDLILDNTMGSGTTGIAAINTNRRFIGIEKEEKYFRIAVERMQEALEKQG